MDYTYYIFAFFVFLLVCATVFLNSRLRRDRKEEEAKLQPRPDDFSEREEELRLLFRKLEQSMAGMEEEIREAREEIGAQRDEVASMLETMQHLSASVRSAETAEKRGRGRPRIHPAAESAANPAAPAGRGKPGPKKKTLGDKVRELAEAGMPTDKIAQELQVSRGEVDLALGIEHKKSMGNS